VNPHLGAWLFPRRAIWASLLHGSLAAEDVDFWLLFPLKLAIFAAAIFIAGPAGAQKLDPRLITGCAPCHGANGISKFGEVPNLAGQNEPYLVNQLRAFHTGRRPHKEMAYMSRKLTEEEIEAIAAYFSTLPPR